MTSRSCLSIFFGASAIILSGCGPTHTLSRSETVCLERSICYERADGSWVIPVRGSVYQKSWLNHIEPDLMHWLRSHHLVKTPEDEARLASRLALFLEDHPSNIALQVQVGSDLKTLKPSQGGLIRDDIVLTAEEVRQSQSRAEPKDGWMAFPIRMARGDARQFQCEAQVIPRKGLSIVSDIDDTIKITDVNNTKLMLENTFLLPYRSIPGMAQQYSVWQREKGATFHYLSLGPVQLYNPLIELFAADGFPKGTMDLPMIKWGRSKLKGFMTLMDGTKDFKVDQLSRLISALPERDYILIGDSSQHDPEAYGTIARQYPRQVKRILIHDVTCQGPDAPRYAEAFRELPRDLWQIYREAAEIRDSIPANVP